MQQNRIDWPAFATCLIIILAVCIPLAASPETGGALLQRAYDYIAAEFGIAYLLASVGAIGFLAWLAASRYGPTLLGESGVAPEFSTVSWIAMLFSAGVGAGLLYWCVVEWAFYYQTPPFGVQPFSPAAAEWASTYGLFHWGVTAWAFYCLPAVAIGYAFYVRKQKTLRFSESCQYFLQGREDGYLARAIDLLFMIALIGGAASSLGFSTPMIAACIGWLLGVEASFSLEVAVMFLCLAIFATSVWLGLQKGIKRLSDVNMVLAFILLAFVLIVGPTTFLLKTSLNGVGMMLQNFVRMNFWSDPFTDSGFVEAWTVFYWAWWIAYAPFVGMFVARISRGRTIRQVIVGMLVFGSLGSWLFYMIIGNYSLFLELEGILAVTEVLNEQGHNAAIVATLETLPLTPLVVGVFTLVSLVFVATTYDSASYALAAGATRELDAEGNPARWHRVFWAFALGLLPVTLMFIGGLKVMQVTLLVVSAPILVVGVVMSVSLVKSLRADSR